MIVPLSDRMKKGAEPLRSFSDLAQFLGHIQPVDPAEEKRRKKEDKFANKREAKTDNTNEAVLPAVAGRIGLDSSETQGTVIPVSDTSVSDTLISDVPVNDIPPIDRHLTEPPNEG